MTIPTHVQGWGPAVGGKRKREREKDRGRARERQTETEIKVREKWRTGASFKCRFLKE